MKQIEENYHGLWDYTCFHCGGRGHPSGDGRGHLKDCPLRKKELKT